MNRKNFLSSLLMSSATIPNLSRFNVSEPFLEPDLKLPPYLKRGDVIGITSPAGYTEYEKLQPAIKQMESWGLKIRIGQSIGKRDFTFGGTDEERRRDFQIMLDDNSIQAIMCARGGYGMTRILDQLEFSRFKLKPKWIIGFSDITAIHLHLDRNLGIASIHSKMCNSFPDEWDQAEPIVQETIESIRRALTGTKMNYKAEAQTNNRLGVAKGRLIGGNLSMIQNLMATRSELRAEGKILFIEDVGEYLYNIDRMMVNLYRAGKLEKLNGLVVGGFNKIKPDDPGEEFGKTVYEIIMDKVKAFKYPVCFDFPVGHQKNNFALKCGVEHLLSVRNDGVELSETES